ncbi:MAG: hypothetical protein LBH92_05245 [Bacteroidales bacterium]|jgi:hypothetical protein|nr:hypothetical protein [Bacteroidales bacterium]
MKEWFGSTGAFSSLSLTFQYNQNYIIREGYTQCAAAGDVEAIVSCMLHEIGHSLFDAPHYMGANGVMGKYFNFPTIGWGIMHNTLNWSANAWERWILGWTELTTGNGQVNSDIQSASDLQNNGIYTIRDLNTTGDIIRVKIPHLDNCYLWIENHQNISLFDYKRDEGTQMSIDGEVIAGISPGLYMFIENDNGSRLKRPSGANKLYILNAQGNYDYWHPPTPPEPSENYVYNNILYPFKQMEENPISGVNPYYKVPDDYPTDWADPTSTNDTIFTGSNGEKIKEAYDILRETNGTDTKITYARWGGVNEEAATYFNRRSDAFLAGDEVGLSGIAPALAPPTYSRSTCKTESYILNGVSVQVLSYNEIEKSFTIQIKMNDYTIRRDKRWCGYIDLVKNTLPSSGSGSDKAASNPGDTLQQAHIPDLILGEGIKLTLDKTGTPNRHLKHPYFDDFFNPTVFTIKEGATFSMHPNSTLVVKNNSTLVIESGAWLRMEQGARILVKKGSNLVIKNGAHITIQRKARIDIEEDAYICLENGASLHIIETGSLNLVCNVNAGIHPGCDATGNAISVANILNYPFTGTGHITSCTSPVIYYVQDETFTGYHYLSKYKIIAGDHVTNSKPFGPVKVESGSTVIFKTIDCVEIRDCFDVELGAEFIIEPANEEN